MTIHVARDFLSNVTTLPSSTVYYTAIFAFHTLGFTQAGHTGLDISGSLMVASGLSASINFGATGSINTVGVPAWHTVQAADVGRILALRSDANPRHNSGLFRIVGVVTASNRYNIDYRSPDAPPAESGTLKWAVFANENTLQGATPYQAGGATPNTSSGGYASSGAGYAGKRILLQSPHASGWQVRFCQESSLDRANHGAQWTVAPGVGGDARGDFPTGSIDTSAPYVQHLHGPAWFNVSNANYQGTVVGVEPISGDLSNAQVRFYAWGDDVSGSVCVAVRNVSGYADGWFSFGMAEDDEPEPPLVGQRLYAFGRANSSTQDIRWDNGPAFRNRYTGVSLGTQGRPTSCCWSLYDYVGNTGGGGPKSETVAADNALLGATELQGVDLWSGTVDSGYDIDTSWPAVAVLQWDPRRLGTLPIARVGRANFGDWAASSDAARSWMHLKGGVYMPWQGPALLS